MPTADKSVTPSDPMMNNGEYLSEALAHNAEIGGTRMIEYKGLVVMAPLRDIKESLAMMQVNDEEFRHDLMASANRYLRRNFRSVKNQTASHEVAMNCAMDVAIWFANEIFEGRATLETH
jgi:hypothetical protein